MIFYTFFDDMVMVTAVDIFLIKKSSCHLIKTDPGIDLWWLERIKSLYHECHFLIIL